MSTSTYSNTDNEQIYKVFNQKLINFYKNNFSYLDDFYNRNVSKNILLGNNDNYNFIIFSIDFPVFMISENIKNLMEMNNQLEYIPYINNNENIMFSHKDCYSIIYIKSKETFIDVLNFLIADHPTYYLCLLNGLCGWSELNDELINHETYFLGNHDTYNYSLTNIEYCTVLKLHNNVKLQAIIPNLINTTFEIVEICYEPLTDNSNIFGILPKKYHQIKLNHQSYEEWENCYNLGIIPDDFINKIIYLKTSDITKASYNKANFIKRLLLSKNFVEIICRLEINSMNSIDLLKSIVSNDNIQKVGIFNYYAHNFRFSFNKINVQVGNNIKYLRMTKMLNHDAICTLCFSSKSNLKELVTSFPIKCDINLFTKLEKIDIQGDEILNNLIHILEIKPKKLICKLCEFKNINYIEIRHFYMLLDYPNMDEQFHLTTFIIHPLNPIEQKNHISTSQNITHNCVRNKSLTYYSK